MRKFLMLLLVLVMTLSLVACGGGAEEKKSEDGQVVVGVVAIDLGTQSFNDDVVAGLTAAESSLGIKKMVIEMQALSDLENSLNTLIDEGAEIVVVPSGEYKDVMVKVAKERPETKFIFTEGLVEEPSNVISLVYRENEAAFLAGALGAKMSKSGKLGAVLAVASDVQNKYLAGFSAGAKAVNPEVEVQSVYTNSYSDTGKGLEVARAMFSQGADYIGTYAGACNLGVFQAAQEKGEGVFCFGAATGQFDKNKEQILASVVKPIDKVLESVLKEYVDGNLDGSKPFSLGLKENGVILRWTDQNEELLKSVPQDVKDTIEDLAKKVMDGTIEVPVDEDSLKAFNYQHK